MIAKIIVDHRSKKVDRVFDYLIPVELEGEITVGSRVIVPFSGGNKQVEGFCVGISQESDVKKLKYILKCSDMPRAFDEKMLEIINWMHNKYLVSYLDIIHTIVPTGSVKKGIEIITLLNSQISKKHTVNEIVSKLTELGGTVELSYLLSMFDCDIRGQIRSMINSGVIKKEYKHISKVTDKKQKFVKLLISDADVEDLVQKISKKAPVQAKILKALQKKSEMPVSEFKVWSGSAQNAVLSLSKKGYVKILDTEIERNPINAKLNKKTNKAVATPEQKNAIDNICGCINENECKTFLLHGVTGSGKTEVFMQTIEYAVNEGKGALVLVPEISLTPQMVSRFVSRFGDRVAVLHSALSMGERYDQWKRINEGRADIVIGARSAVFSPLKNIGIIIIDEEHSDTYKSEMTPRYHAKDVALMRAKQYGAVTVMASATPCVESMYKARNSKYTLLTMQKRYNENAMPQISVIDMRAELEGGNKSMFSDSLRNEIERNLENKEQTILFLNRRGFSTFVSCRSCGYVAKCPNCNISLTYHRFSNDLKCHYCGYTHSNYNICPSCKSKYIRYFGGGTQKVEEEIKKLFPNASVLRMDIDTTGKKQSHEILLNKFSEEKIDILIGTQMVAKGLDFENVTLVGVISADTMLHINDYRSAERTFSVLEQVTGRAGRGEKSGRAVIQTYDPENVAISLVKNHNYNEFYESEILARKLMQYPPFSEIICVMFTGHNQVLTSRAAMYFLKNFKNTDAHILGPIPAAISKINNKYRYQIIIKCKNADDFNDSLKTARDACTNHRDYENVTVIIDKNPNMIG